MVGDTRELAWPDPGPSGGPPGGGWSRWSVRSSGEVVPVLERIAEALEAAGYGRQDVFGVRLALEEAIVNALRHGHRHDPGKAVRVRCRVTPACVEAEVEDEGEGFDPDRVPDPRAPENWGRDSGRGLLLMRKYMNVRYNATGTCVNLVRQRAAGVGAAPARPHLAGRRPAP
jgi:serine/threonine-protein kinase RsbW